MEQVKTFSHESGSWEKLDAQVNKWLKENDQEVVIKDRLLTATSYRIFITIFYVIIEEPCKKT